MLDPYLSNNNNKKTNQMDISKIKHNKKNNQIKKHQKIIISNIEILFPYSPHESQIIFMKTIIYNLNQKFLNKITYRGICALESPPGTKKILCILCACLAWMYDMRKTNTYKGKIIFVLKNYQKISKTIKQLDLIFYKPKICVLFSPYESCPNGGINGGNNDNITFINCRNERDNCEYYHNLKKKNNLGKNEEYLNIEEFNNFTCENKVCPFLFEKNKLYNCDIIFITYENFFDKNLKNIYEYEIKDNILILDEGENLDKICENYESISISILDLEEIKKTLFEFAGNQYIENIIKNEEYNINISDIKSEILSIDRIISNIYLKKDRIYNGEVFPNKGLKLRSKEFLSLFLTKNDVNINDMQYITLSNIKLHILLLMNIEKLINLYFSKNTKIPILSSILEKIYNFYIKQDENIIDSYTFFIFFDKKEQNDQNIKLNIYCFDPSISFKDFILDEKPFSVFLISNYFGPYDLLENEFKIRFDTKLKNNCIYPSDNFQINIIQSTLYKEEQIEFLLDEINSDNIKMKIALGYTLLSLCYSNPQGSILVFFPSMTYLYQCNLLWKENNIIENISKIKKVKYFQEKEEFYVNEPINDNCIYFLEFDINNSSNKLSKFKNKNISMVIILGIPQEKQYNFNDKIQLKINYIDSKKNKILENKTNINFSDDYNLDETSGERWNEKNIMTPINIFISKTLKLMNGLGTIICIDNRYIDAINNGCFCWFLKNKVEIVNIQNRYYFNDLFSFYQKIDNKIKNFYNEQNFINNNEEKNCDYNYINNNKGNNNDIEEGENFFINKRNKTKLFYIQNKINKNIENKINTENNYINLSNNETISKKKYNIINNDINIDLLKKKQKRIDEEENGIIIKNHIKKNKKDEQNIYDTNIFQNIVDEYDQIEKEKEDNELNNAEDNIDNDEEIEYDLDTELLSKLNKNEFIEESNDIFECPICFKISKDFPDLIYSRAKCKHVLCNDCWCGWFSEKFECPLCKKKARPKTLKRIIFTN